MKNPSLIFDMRDYNFSKSSIPSLKKMRLTRIRQSVGCFNTVSFPYVLKVIKRVSGKKVNFLEKMPKISCCFPPKKVNLSITRRTWIKKKF
jgi:hypothetical protein